MLENKIVLVCFEMYICKYIIVNKLKFCLEKQLNGWKSGEDMYVCDLRFYGMACALHRNSVQNQQRQINERLHSRLRESVSQALLCITTFDTTFVTHTQHATKQSSQLEK